MSTILVVDDMAICREPIAEALRLHGYNTICAANGAEALSILRERPADLVLLDVNMPELDGLAVLTTIRRNPGLKQLPVVLLTDRKERKIITQAAECGVQGYLLKSKFSVDELLARIEGCLRGVPVASATSVGTQAKEGGEGYRNWRSSIEEKVTGVSRSLRLAKPATTPATTVKQRQASPGSTAALDQADQPSVTRSVNDLVPVITKNDLMKLVNEGLKLRPLGPTVDNVIAVTGSADCCAEDVAKAVSHDQVLCIRLLKLANSSAYSRGRLVDSVKEAVQRIGVQEVRSLVMTLGIFKQFEGAVAEHVDPHLFWEHSIACGLVASTFAKARRSENVDNCFLWGMLHDVGRLILLEHVSDQYVGVWEAAEELGVPLECVEAKMMLLDHCDILARALEHWQFQRDFIAPVVNHHRPVSSLQRLGPAHCEAAATIALANRITHALLIGSSGNGVIYPLDDLVETLNLSPSEISEIVAKVPDETDSLKYSMLARTNENAWPDFTSQVKGRLDTEFRPLCVSAEPDVDAYRMFCERIASSDSSEPPNLGVIYLRNAGEFVKVRDYYDTQEKVRGASDTPVILVLGRGKVDTEQPWLSSRRHAVLNAPTRISDFITAIRELLA